MAGNRKNELKALFAGGLAPAETARAPDTKASPDTELAEPVPAGDTGVLHRNPSGAVKAMGLSLGAMTREVEEARVLRQSINEGERIVNIHPDKIDASFIEDRLRLDNRDDEDFAALIDSIGENGQQVPALLRPHPDKNGRYETAYGHRRVRAAARLGIEVRAIVRNLSDDELVLAQGKENTERRNLTFIERGLFAKNLSRRGFDRKIIGDALAVQKSELSRLMAVVESIPETVIRMIGPAPKVGRDRWMKLGQMLQKKNAEAIANDEMHYQRFQAAATDRRFQLVFDRLLRRENPDTPKPLDLRDSRGRMFARITRDPEGRPRKIEFAKHVDAGFIDDTISLLADRYAAFLDDKQPGKE